MSIERILLVVKSIKIDTVCLESDVISVIKEKLVENGIEYRSEVKVASRCRVDILTSDGIVIEVKKGKPNSKAVSSQIKRYAESDMVKAIILVSERGLVSHIMEANGKKVEYVSLSSNWGLTV